MKRSPGDLEERSGLGTSDLDSMEPAFSSPDPFIPPHAANSLGSHTEGGGSFNFP